MIRSLLVGLLLTLGPAAAQAAESPDRYPSKPITIIVPFFRRRSGRQCHALYRQPAGQDLEPAGRGREPHRRGRDDRGRGRGPRRAGRLSPGAAGDRPHHHARHAGEHALPDAAGLHRHHRGQPRAQAGGRAPSVPVASFAELIEKVKQEPGKYGSYGTSGVARWRTFPWNWSTSWPAPSSCTFPTVWRRHAGGPGGRIGCPSGCWTWLGAAALQAGSLKVLAVTSDTRSPLFPDVPTIAEVIPNFQATEWFGIAGPKGVPPAIADKLQAAIKAALSTPEARTRYIEGLGWSCRRPRPRRWTKSWLRRP